MITAEEDGLYDRFLIYSPKVYKRNVEELSASAQQKAAVPEQLQDFTMVLQAINDSHDCIGPKRYVLAPEALQLFKQFKTASIERFNATAGLDVGTANTKDTWFVLRYTAMVSEACWCWLLLYCIRSRYMQ